MIGRYLRLYQPMTQSTDKNCGSFKTLTWGIPGSDMVLDKLFLLILQELIINAIITRNKFFIGF